MKNRKVILTICLAAMSIFASATDYPCFTAFQVEIAGPAAAYMEEQACCEDNSWFHLESELNWNQSLDTAESNYDHCCGTSDELGC